MEKVEVEVEVEEQRERGEREREEERGGPVSSKFAATSNKQQQRLSKATLSNRPAQLRAGKPVDWMR